MKVRFKYFCLFGGLIFVLIFQLLIPFQLSAQYEKNVLKAAYLERITRFIDWHQNPGLRVTENFVIGVYEDNDFFNVLKTVLENKTIKGKPVEVIQIRNLKKIEICDLLYISGIKENEVSGIITIANKCGILTVSEIEGFGVKGIHINFFIEDKKLKFEINRHSIDLGKFKVSSLLLKNSNII